MPPVSKELPARAIAAQSLRAWRRDFLYVTVMAGMVQLPVVAVQLAVFGDDGVRVSTNDDSPVWVIGLGVFLTAMLAHHFLAGMLEELEGAERDGEPRPTISHLLHKLPWRRLVVADLLITFITVVGLVLLIIPGLVIAAVFSLALPLLNMERQPVLPTLRRSWALARPHLWTVTWIWILAQTTVVVGSDILGGLFHAFGHTYVYDLLGHVVPEALLLPVGALPIVMITYRLTDAERVETSDAL